MAKFDQTTLIKVLAAAVVLFMMYHIFVKVCGGETYAAAPEDIDEDFAENDEEGPWTDYEDDSVEEDMEEDDEDMEEDEEDEDDDFEEQWEEEEDSADLAEDEEPWEEGDEDMEEEDGKEEFTLMESTVDDSYANAVFTPSRM